MIPAPMSHPKFWIFPSVLALVCLLLALLGNPATEWLQFDRSALHQGQIWRLLSANLVHLSFSHLWLNLAGLLLLWVFFARYYTTKQWTLLLAICSLTTAMGLLVFSPDLEWYVGLSGTLHGLFIAGALRDLRQKQVEAYVLLGLIIGKLLWEQFQGPLPGSEETAGGLVIVDAHLYGAIGGLSGLLLKRGNGGHSSPTNLKPR